MKLKKITEPSSLKSDLRGLLACTWICHYTLFEVVRMLLI